MRVCACLCACVFVRVFCVLAPECVNLNLTTILDGITDTDFFNYNY